MQTKRENLDGRCASCGFLARRSWTTVSASYEIELQERLLIIGQVVEPLTTGTSTKEEWTSVECYRKAALLSTEIDDLSSDGIDSRQALRDVVYKDRQCPKWREHIDGLNPNERLKILLSEQSEESRQQFERQLEAQRANSNRILKWVAIVGVLLALLQVLAAIAGLGPD